MTRRRSFLAMLASLFGFGAVAKADATTQYTTGVLPVLPLTKTEHVKAVCHFVPGPHGLLYDVLEKGEAMAFRVDDQGRLIQIDWYDIEPWDVIVAIGISPETGELWMCERFVATSKPSRDDQLGTVTTFTGHTINIIAGNYRDSMSKAPTVNKEPKV